MNRRMIAFLGALAGAGRRVGGRSLFSGLRDAADGVAIRWGIPPLSVAIGGMRLAGFFRHRSFLQGIAAGSYESETQKVFRALVPEANVFVDAGAHIGYFTLLAGALLPRGARAFAIEPDPYNLRALQINRERNRLPAVQIVPKALSNECGSAQMLFSDAAIGNSLILGRPDIGRTTLQTVDTVSLDSLLTGLPLDSLLVKMDLEGAELLALEGMRVTIGRARRTAMICENNPSALAAGGNSPAELIRSLRALGFEPHYISDEYRGLIPVASDCPYKGNFLCTRHWEIPKDWILP